MIVFIQMISKQLFLQDIVDQHHQTDQDAHCLHPTLQQFFHCYIMELQFQNVINYYRQYDREFFNIRNY
jgi:hypothetical protein